MKKAISAVISMVLVAFLAGTIAHADTGRGATPEWIELDENRDSYFSYDKAGVAKPREGIRQITARVVYTPEGRAEALTILQPAKDYERLSESRYVYELDCKGRKSKLLGVTHLDADGARIKTFDISAVTEWEDIPPAARLELINELVCAPDRERLRVGTVQIPVNSCTLRSRSSTLTRTTFAFSSSLRTIPCSTHSRIRRWSMPYFCAASSRVYQVFSIDMESSSARIIC